MITEKDLQEAIAECLGQKNPNSNTCIKLAAFYTIKNELFPVSEEKEIQRYSYSPAEPQNTIVTYDGESEFAKAIYGKDLNFIFDIIDELLQTIKIINPNLYNAVLRKIDGF